MKHGSSGVLGHVLVDHLGFRVQVDSNAQCAQAHDDFTCKLDIVFTDVTGLVEADDAVSLVFVPDEVEQFGGNVLGDVGEGFTLQRFDDLLVHPTRCQGVGSKSLGLLGVALLTSRPLVVVLVEGTPLSARAVGGCLEVKDGELDLRVPFGDVDSVDFHGVSLSTPRG